jgi:hypothetical protein
MQQSKKLTRIEEKMVKELIRGVEYRSRLSDALLDKSTMDEILESRSAVLTPDQRRLFSEHSKRLDKIIGDISGFISSESSEYAKASLTSPEEFISNFKSMRAQSQEDLERLNGLSVDARVDPWSRGKLNNIIKTMNDIKINRLVKIAGDSDNPEELRRSVLLFLANGEKDERSQLISIYNSGEDSASVKELLNNLIRASLKAELSYVEFASADPGLSKYTKYLMQDRAYELRQALPVEKEHEDGEVNVIAKLKEALKPSTSKEDRERTILNLLTLAVKNNGKIEGLIIPIQFIPNGDENVLGIRDFIRKEN